MNVRVIAGRSNAKGSLRLDLPEGWNSFPEKHEFTMDQKNEEQVFTFEISPPNDASDGIVTVISEVGGVEFKKGRKVIEYNHIPTQTLFPNSQTRVVKL